MRGILIAVFTLIPVYHSALYLMYSEISVQRGMQQRYKMVSIYFKAIIDRSQVSTPRFAVSMKHFRVSLTEVTGWDLGRQKWLLWNIARNVESLRHF